MWEDIPACTYTLFTHTESQEWAGSRMLTFLLASDHSMDDLKKCHNLYSYYYIVLHATALPLTNTNIKWRDFRLPPWSSWELHFSGLLRSKQWFNYSLRNNPEECSSHKMTRLIFQFLCTTYKKTYYQWTQIKICNKCQIVLIFVYLTSISNHKTWYTAFYELMW
jgi:hypothetical protein